MVSPLLELSNVTVMRGDRVALAGVTLRIEQGEHACILGPNGCGKSTLIKTLTRECYPVVDEGSSMAILGKERWDVGELRSHLGIVSPDFSRRARRRPRDATSSSPGSSAARASSLITTRGRSSSRARRRRSPGSDSRTSPTAR